MKNIGFTDDQKSSVLSIVVAILNMGNIEFDSVNIAGVGDVAQVSKDTKEYFENAAKYFFLSTDDLFKAMSTRV